MTEKQNLSQTFAEHFAVLEKKLNGKAGTPQHKARQKAMNRFKEVGFPTIKDEEWKYTSLAPLLKVHFQPVAEVPALAPVEDDIAQYRADYPVAAELVFLNGAFSAELSKIFALPDNVFAGAMALAIEQNHPAIEQHLGKHVKLDDNGFVSLNSAFLRDGLLIDVPDNTQVELPIHVIHYTSSPSDESVVAHPRKLVVAGRSASVKIVETHAGTAGSKYFTNYVSETVAADNAQVETYLLQHHNEEAFQITNRYAELGRDANAKFFSFDFGGRLVRNDFTMVMNGEGGEGTLNGLFMPRGDQHIDNHTLIDHAKPHCDSHELYKGILDGESHGVFSGKIIVREDAQKTDAKQSNNNLLLSKKAIVDTKPQLEIFADDVKCTHGATIGRMDELALFYLRSRGIPAREASNVLSFAFASELVEGVSVEGLRIQLDDYIHQRLEESFSQEN